MCSYCPMAWLHLLTASPYSPALDDAPKHQDILVPYWFMPGCLV